MTTQQEKANSLPVDFTLSNGIVVERVSNKDKEEQAKRMAEYKDIIMHKLEERR